MKGYWNQPDETRTCCARDADGRLWFHTGDIATIDEDGFTTIVQRKKDMIIVDGFNVYPSDVEAVLYMHPGRPAGRRHRRAATRITARSCGHASSSSQGIGRPADELIAHCKTSARSVQGAAAGRAPRDAADERGRQDSVPRAPRRAAVRA